MDWDCSHESWECMYGWHTCNDCKVHLGSRQLIYEDHMADDCDICGPHVEHEAEGATGCVLPHPCPNKSYAHKVSTKTPPRPRIKGGAESMVRHGGRVHSPEVVCDLCKAIEPPKFITKDSGKREEYDSGMRRDTQEGKPRFDLLLVPNLPYEEQFLTRIARLLERGAVKYGERNWELAEGPEEEARFRSSALRHMMQWACGEVDEDHAAATAFNLMAAEYVKWKRENAT